MIVYPDQLIPPGYHRAYSRPGMIASQELRICYPWGVHLVARVGAWLAILPKGLWTAVITCWRAVRMTRAEVCTCERCESKRETALTMARSTGVDPRGLLERAVTCQCGNFMLAVGNTDPQIVGTTLEGCGWRQIDTRWKCAQCCGTTKQALRRARPLEEPND